MATPTPGDLLAALRDFVTEVDEFDPTAPALGELSVRIGDQEIRLTCRASAAEALIRALRDYHDPRDRGRCDHCGSRWIDDNFLCRGCGRANGLFGQMLLERAGRFTETPAVETGADIVAGSGDDAG
jgi:hypothetical protein